MKTGWILIIKVLTFGLSRNNEAGENQENIIIRYLGDVSASNLTWVPYFDNVCCKLSRALQVLRQIYSFHKRELHALQWKQIIMNHTDQFRILTSTNQYIFQDYTYVKAKNFLTLTARARHHQKQNISLIRPKLTQITKEK